MTLFEALMGGAFDRLNWQHSGEFDQNFSKKSNAPGFARGAGMGGFGIDWYISSQIYEQRSETTRRRLCCEKLGTSHDFKGFAIGSFLECIVVERANDVLCSKNIKNAGLISAKPIDF